MTDQERCPVCSKVIYRRWSEAAHDCRSIRLHVKKARTIHPYWSRACQSFHVTNQRTRKVA